MKRMKVLFTVAAVIFSGLMFHSCQKDDISSKGAKKVMAVYAEGDCEKECIYENGPFFVKKYSYVYDASAPAKVAFVEIYNTATELIYYIYTENTTFKNLKIDDVLVVDDVASTSYTHVVAIDVFGEDWEACDLKEAKIEVFRNNLTGTGGGNYAKFETAYSLIGVCSGCDTELVGAAISCGEEREANFTFTYDGDLSYVKIQGGLTNFTGADAIVTVTGGVDGAPYTVNQWTPGGSSNRIISVEGPASCTPLVINVKWNSSNSGGVITGDWTAKDGNSNELGYVTPLFCE